jgi:glycosyltransferase involved in cell wall biosynthesis
MRILQVIAALSPRYGGPSVAGPELSRELVRQGHLVSIYTSDIDGRGHLKVPLNSPIQDQGVEVRYFHGWSQSGKYMFSPGLWRALRDHVADFDVVHVWSVYGFSTTAASYWCRQRRVPYLVFPHGSLDPFLRRRNRPRKWIYSKLFAERDYRGADAVMFNTQEEMRLASDWPGLRASHHGHGTQRRVIVPIGIAPEWFAEADPGAGQRFRQRYPALLGKRLIVYFGRINFKKGLDILARAFAEVANGRTDLHLVLAGPDNEGYGQKVRQWLAEKGALECATFTGLLGGEDRFSVLREAEIFALTSYTENFGQSAVEAMASGVPVVISEKVNIWPEVQTAGAGLVVPCDVEATTRAFRNLIDHPELGRKMGACGKRWAAEHLPWSTVGRQMAEAYGQIVCRGRLVGTPVAVRDGVNSGIL